MQDEPHFGYRELAVRSHTSVCDLEDSGRLAHSTPSLGKHASNVFATIVETAHDLIPCSGCILSVHDTATHTARMISTSGLAPQLAGRVLNALSLQPGASPVSKLAGGGLPRPFPILQATLVENGSRIWVLSIVRDFSLGPFEKDDVQTLLKVRGMFRVALKQHVLPFSLYQACWAIVERHASGIALLHVDGHVATANRSAMLLLEGGGRGLAIVNGRLVCPDASNALRLRQALDEVRSAKVNQGRAFLIEGEDGCALLQVNLVRLGNGESVLKDVSIAAFISDPAFFSGPSIEHLQTLYRLTRVEAEVVQLICQGLSPSKAAQKLRISVHTVRSYLKAIFAKIGVNRQADIVRLVANSPTLIQSAN